MRFLLFTLISFFHLINPKAHCLTQAEALEQVKNMDEKEYVERSLKTILYLSIWGDEDHNEIYSEQDNFLPIQLYIGYDQEMIYKELDKAQNDRYFKEYIDQFRNKFFTKQIMKRINSFEEDKEKIYQQRMLCSKLLKYNVGMLSCNELYTYIYTKSTAKTLYLKDDVAVVRLEYIKNPKYFGFFTLKKENDIWKLDNVKCGGRDECEYYQSSLR